MASGSAWTSGREGALILRSSPRPPNSQQGGSLPFLFHRRGGMGTKRSARQAPQSPLRRDREGANQAQVSHHRRPPALHGYGDSMRATPVLQAFSSRKGSTAVQIPEDRQPSAHLTVVSQTEGWHRSRAGPEVRPVQHGFMQAGRRTASRRRPSLRRAAESGPGYPLADPDTVRVLL